MKKITATIVTAYEIKQHDTEPRIEELGYNPEKAITYALEALKYECFTDFTNPYACEAGHAAECFKAEGIEIEKDESEIDIAEKFGWEYAVTLKYKGKQYAFPSDYEEWTEGKTITSEEIKKTGKWPE